MRIRNVTRAGALSLLPLLFAVGSCHRPTSIAEPTSASPLDPASPTPPKTAGLSLAMAEASPHAPEPYVSLTSQDGVGLALVALTARVVVDDPLGFTELRLTFENPEDRVLEGRFRIVLPPGAALSRLAMKIDGDWQEGEIVEKQRARIAYEDALHRKRDPALLEQAAGNELTARIFPIPARGQKEIVLSYSQELGKGVHYTLPLRGLPAVGRLHVEATRAGERAPLQVLDMASAAPTSDFVLEKNVTANDDGMRNGNLVLARVRPVATASADPLDRVLILFDTSASRALGLREQARALVDLAHRAGAAHLVVALFDQDVEPLFAGDAAAFGDVEVKRILARGALGASDLTRALGWAKAAAPRDKSTRVIVMTDGVATAGATEPTALLAAVHGLKDGGVERVDAIALGGIRDDAALRRLVTGGLARDGVVVDGTRDGEEIARRVRETTQSNIPIVVAGAKWVYPARIDGAQAGDEFLVYADVPDGATATMRAGSEAPRALKLRPVEKPLLERAWVGAKIASMTEDAARAGKSGAKLREQIVDLSVTHRVLSPYTALVVLESEDDYARFGLARRALGDVLVVDSGHVARRSHVMPHIPGSSTSLANAMQAASDPSSARGNMWGDAVGDSFGAGGLGLSGEGEGEGGGGRGEGSGLAALGGSGHGMGADTGSSFGTAHAAGAGAVSSGGHATSAPQLRMGAVTVNGRVPAEVIQRIVRQNFGRFRGCYQRGLLRNPQLEGRVAVKFIIGRDGAVVGEQDGGSTLPDASVVQCIVHAFSGLAFPQPDGGIVTVVYPIVFSPDGADGKRIATTMPTPLPVPRSAPTSPPAAPPGLPANALPENVEPYGGEFRDVMNALDRGDTSDALTRAVAWRRQNPGDVLALVALGEALEKSGDLKTAARAYGSIIDLFSDRADMRRFAGERLERVSPNAGVATNDLVVDTFAKAAADRPDHPASHRLLGYARLRHGDDEGAFEAILAGIRQTYPAGRFPGVDRILREDLGLVAAAWIAHAPTREAEITQRTIGAGAYVEAGPSLRFVLDWETDANDVDFYITDALGAQASYRQRALPSGGELYDDVTTGYGPECFAIRGPRENRKGPYKLQANYFAKGPMGYGMGKLEIIDHDGKGHLTFEERPYVIMTDHAFVDLGQYPRERSPTADRAPSASNADSTYKRE